MKIIYYSPHPHLNLMSSAGFGTHMRGMIDAFRKKNCDIRTVILGGETNPPDAPDNKKSKSVKNALKKAAGKNIWRTFRDFNLLWFDRTAASQLAKAIEQFKPDFIYERTNYLQLSGIQMAQKYDITHVSELNTPYVDQQNYLSGSRSYIERYSRIVEEKQLKETDLALAVVGPLKEYFCGRYRLDKTKFLITHDAFDERNIRLDRKNQREIIKHYSLQDQTVVGYVGSIFEWHGLDKIIKAIKELELTNTRLLIVGYGDFATNLKNQVKNLRMENQVIFTGHVPKEEVFDYINIMDVCVAPNAAWYQSPIKIFEYGAMGKPILAPDTAAVREIMESETDGVLVKPQLEDLKRGLMILLGKKDEAVRMGEAFQKKVLGEYTWENNAEKILNAVEEM